jgi:predicted nucleic acid-binding protein
MIAEAEQRGFFVGGERGAKYLSRHPEQVRVLSDYWLNTLRMLALNILFVPIEEDIVVRAQQERVDAGLLTNDSIIVATMREYGITQVATNGPPI